VLFAAGKCAAIQCEVQARHVSIVASHRFPKTNIEHQFVETLRQVAISFRAAHRGRG